MISARPGRRAGVQRLIERADQVENRLLKGHVDTGADPSNEERIGGRAVITTRIEAPGEGVGALEPLLRLRLQLQRERQSGDAQRSRVGEAP